MRNKFLVIGDIFGECKKYIVTCKEEFVIYVNKFIY